MLTSPFQRDGAFEARTALLARLNVLNAESEPCFDRLVRIAAQAAGTPISLVTFLGPDRQWIKANVGFDQPSTPLSDAFCVFALSGTNLLEVPDATEDVRVKDNALVIGEQHIRFYAGHPIVFHGLILGTVCVLDRVPRQLDQGMKQILADLSGVVTDVLEKRHQQQLVDEERKRVAEEKINREIAEQATKNKSKFLSRVSHELRTPLNAIIGFGQLLLIDPSSPLSDIQRERVETLHMAGMQLLTLVDDMLELSRVEQGTLALDMQALSLRPLVNQAIQLMAPEVQALGLTLRANIGPDVMVWADKRAVNQILLNLLSNAVKYNQPQGHVFISVVENEDVLLTVQNSGKALTPEQLGALFQPFNRLGAESTSIAGCGLGLVITKSLVDAMGGALTIESLPSIGTRVHVRLKRVGPREPGPAMQR